MTEFLADALNLLCLLLLDIFLWVYELVYELVNEFLAYVIETLTDWIVELIGNVKEHIPRDLIDSIVTAYEWLGYAETWIPMTYVIGLFVAYMSIRLVMTVVRVILRLIPFIG